MGENQEKKAERMLRNAERTKQTPSKANRARKVRAEKPSQEPAFHWCMTSMSAGRCPRCDGKPVYELYCRICCRVHENTATCQAWKIPITIVLLDGGGRPPEPEATARSVIREIEREARRRR